MMTKVDRARFAAAVLAKLAWIAGILATKGWPAFAAWWLATYTRFLQSPCRQLVARVGRRGGKSSWVCVFAVAFALVYAGLGLVPPGDIGWCVFVSVSREEAAARLRTIRLILDAIDVKYAIDGDTIVISGTNIGFRVQACTVASVSGWTSVLIVCDELVRWMNRDTGQNPASKVLETLGPTLATQPLGLWLLLSSVEGNEDAHAKAYARGDNAFQMTAFAETWVANETLSEEYTHTLEPDERVWRREYACIPQGSSMAAFDYDSVIHAFQPLQIDQIVSNSVIGLDPAGRGRDAFGICAGAWGVQKIDPDAGLEREPILYEDGRVFAYLVHRDRPRAPVPPSTQKLYLWNFRSIDSRFRAELGITGIVDKIMVLAHEVGATMAATDGSEAFSLSTLLPQRQLRTEVFSMGGGNYVRVVSRLRQLLNARSVCVEGSDRVREQFTNFEERITANGISYEQGRDSGGTHFDDLSSALQIVRCDLEGCMAGSPGAKPGGGGGRGLVAYHIDGSITRHGGAQPLR